MNSTTLQIPINTHKTLRGPRESQNGMLRVKKKKLANYITIVWKKLNEAGGQKRQKHVIWELSGVCKSGDESAQKDSTVVDTGVPRRVLLTMLMLYTCELKLNI